MTNARLLFVHALSPLHAGTGQSTGAIDLAIARDRATEHPCIPGSSIKGSLRGYATDEGRRDIADIFGPEAANDTPFAGSVVFGDANLLLLPVRSVAGTFAWVTSPFLLARFARDAREVGLNVPSLPSALSIGQCVAATTCQINLTQGNQDKVILEDFDLQRLTQGGASDAAALWANELASFLFDQFDPDNFWKGLFKQKFCVVHDDVMTFLSRHATDVSTRVAIEHNSKTVKDGQLWTEENLPPETILSGLLLAMPNGNTTKNATALFKVVEEITQKTIQLGGNASVGRGRCRLFLQGGE